MGAILKTMFLKLLTTKVITKLVIIGLESLAARTDSKVDDKIVTVLKDALA